MGGYMQLAEEVATRTDAGSSGLKNRYFLITRGADAIEWFPPHYAESMPRDCIYFGRAFAEMEKLCRLQGLRVYVTYDWNSLPEYGEQVVVLLLGEEIGRVPRYIRHVGAVFKTMRMRPYLGIRNWKLDALRFGLLVKAVRDWAGHWISTYAAAHPPRAWPRRVHKDATCLDVPLGYLNLEELPQKTMRERPFHGFFAGQVVAPKKAGVLGLVPLPKNESRKSMLASVEKLMRRHSGFRFDGPGVDDFATGQQISDRRSYSQRMMDAKLCLAPRGNVVDTFRFFEGMRSGCVVVCEPLPPERFYAGAPVIEISDWNELADKIVPLFEDDEALEILRQRTLDWWEKKSSEAATGREMARFIEDRSAVRRSP
jgi:hypothetical protein